MSDTICITKTTSDDPVYRLTCTRVPVRRARNTVSCVPDCPGHPICQTCLDRAVNSGTSVEVLPL
jgi:hypothetical protein